MNPNPEHRTTVAVAMMRHETNTFSPVVTDLARFSAGARVPPSGDDVIASYANTASCLGGFLAACAEHDVDLVVPLAAAAAPSGPVEDDAYEYMVAAILEAATGCDAMLLDLHGAMVTRTFDDGEGELLRRIRAISPDLPIAVSLDMHANLTDAMIQNCSAIAGYKTYPHVDMDETAERVAGIVFDQLAGKCNPTMAWGNAPMLPHVMRQGTGDQPNRGLQAKATALTREHHALASVFTGFPHADIHEAGLSVVVVTNDEPDRADALCTSLLDDAWAERESFVYQVEPLADSLDRAAATADQPGDGPVLILDHYDNAASGGTMDTTEVLGAVLDRQLTDVAMFAIFDPESVSRMAEAGVGREVTLELGGKLPMPSLARQSRPLRVTGRVKSLSDGLFTATGAMSRGLVLNMGTTAVLRLSNQVDVVVISRHVEPFDPGCLRSLGIEPRSRRFIMLKSRVHYRVGFAGIARAVVECAGLGVCTSDYAEVTFHKVRRPIYPLDDLAVRV